MKILIGKQPKQLEAYIYKTSVPSNVTKQLKIDNKGIRFLDDSVKSTSSFTSIEENEWQLTFFEKTSFEITLSVVFNPEKVDRKGCEAKAIWLNEDLSTKSELTLEVTKKISEFVRDSNSLSKEQFIETSANRFFTADRDSIGYIAFSKDQFERAIICQCLAIAYKILILGFRKQVTKAVNQNNINNDDLLSIYKEVLIFNAAHFFRYPVDLTNHELRVIWDIIHDNWCLEELNTELTQQLDVVAKLLQAENDRKQEQLKQQKLTQQKENDHKLQQLKEKELKQQNQRKQKQEEQQRQKAERDAKFNKKMTLFGIIIALLSALSLVELTPQHFTDAYQNWGNVINHYSPVFSTSETKTP